MPERSFDSCCHNFRSTCLRLATISFVDRQGQTPSCSAGRITSAINPKRLNAETWALGTGLFYLFALEKLSIEKEFFFSSQTLPGRPNCLLFKGPTCQWASWQPRQSATDANHTNQVCDYTDRQTVNPLTDLAQTSIRTYVHADKSVH
ncbi:hypothetical protein AVEN_154672-1 [Araneus ventricosus]|uniref:Uncharacterized protein n=1 Tax=Araneus ventricosus TaxID=182803 RepID=A0A4Y2VHQ3_ARAVE|nr:hypothetical protein AVEN_117618-1 [Araneus ventricosus]GBO24149.1 hypothetical protein AVEN_160056-1 [Araneus ventricosus]GBO24151.1 hypothetical protein AVEN_207682-1 [Araneus ventricosus]GBO24154.1 hypothetical protein AVEN_154672-1 [Araneus ventricosus]